MDLIEQAIFYIDRKQAENSCQILDVTPGIHQIDLNEIMAVASDVQAHFPVSCDETNPLLFFHSLPSGSYLLGKVIHGNNDADQQDVQRYYVHGLILTPQILEAFCNNPIFLYNALLQKSDFHFFEPNGHFFHVGPFALESTSEKIRNRDLFEILQDFPGPARMATMVRSCMDSICSFFSDGPPPVQLLSGLIQCFPMPLRLDISFATGLWFSQTHPLRMMTVESHSPVIRSICHDYVIPFFSFLKIHQNNFEANEFRKYWPQLIYRVFKTGEFEFLAQKLDEFAWQPSDDERETPSEWSQLQELGRKFLLELDAKTAHSNKGRSSSKITSPYKGGSLRADGVHPIFVIPDQQQPDASSRDTDTTISTGNLGKIYPDWTEEFRKMDSLTARALFGDHVALEALEKHWETFSYRMSQNERGRISEAYIHLVQSILTQPRDPNFPKHPRRSIDALEVLNIFIGEH